jgi:hypothetical protein
VSIVLLAGLLGACTTAPVTPPASINGFGYGPPLAPTGHFDPRLARPSLYMDDDAPLPWLRDMPRSNR